MADLLKLVALVVQNVADMRKAGPWGGLCGQLQCQPQVGTDTAHNGIL